MREVRILSQGSIAIADAEQLVSENRWWAKRC
jgi:hypothetical protein